MRKGMKIYYGWEVSDILTFAYYLFSNSNIRNSFAGCAEKSVGIYSIYN
jgi:hypothetical protein